MAERTVVDRRRSIGLPPDCDPVAVAAAMNPAMSSWVALRRRFRLDPGQRVLVLGATGNAGQIAIQVARSGRGSVATGDIPAELTALAAEVIAGTFTVNARGVPLEQVEQAWSETATTDPTGPHSAAGRRLIIGQQPGTGGSAGSGHERVMDRAGPRQA